MPFRLQTRFLFLTYPHCTIDGNTALVQLLDKFPEAQNIITCEEEHEDGSPHIHAAIRLRTRINLRDERRCDLGEFHPNIQGCRSWPKARNYCKKGGSFFEYEEDDSRPDADIDEDDQYDVCACSTREEWIKHCIRTKIAYAYAEEIWKNFHDKKGVVIEEGQPIGGLMCMQLLHQMAPQGKSIICYGTSGVGKTTWAKTIANKPALWITHMDDLKHFDSEEHRSIIFDDLSFTHYPVQAQIHLVDTDDSRTLHIRYKTVTIAAGVQKIFTCNTFPFMEGNEAIDRRVFVIKV